MLATAQLLPPDAVDLARVRIPESIEREGFCPVTLTRPGGDRPLFRALGITWRAATDAAQARVERQLQCDTATITMRQTEVSGVKEERHPLPGPRGGLIHAYDQETGAVVWRHEPEDVHPLGTPMTYLHRGRQFLVLSVGTADGRGRLLALALPLADRAVSPAPPR